MGAIIAKKMYISFTNFLRDAGQLRAKSILPVILGASIGFALSMVYIPVVEQLCLSDLEHSTYTEDSTPNKNNIVSTNSQKHVAERVKQEPLKAELNVIPVAPKKNQFNYDYRPYFVYSELGFRFKLIIAVLTSEKRLDEYGVAINNTWGQILPKVVFFTPYSKNVNFHERYNRHLNLKVVQLPDVDEDSTRVDLMFKMFQYLKDHFSPNYDMFMKVDDNAYINAEQLLHIVNNLNASKDLYVGHAKKFEGTYTLERNGNWKDWTGDHFCFGGSGVIISRSTLLKLVANIDVCKTRRYSDENHQLEHCIRKAVGIGCKYSEDIQEAIQVSTDEGAYTEQKIKERFVLREAAVLYPVQSSNHILQLHKFFTMRKAKKTFSDIRKLQTDIQQTVPNLPPGVPEKVLRWPVGFTDPFKPNGRFEVIHWRYFDKESIYGDIDSAPATEISDTERKDLDEILKTASSALKKELKDLSDNDMKLRTGLKRHDPKRGSEYILDYYVEQPGSLSVTRRVHLLRPFTKVEALSMPPATEQRGIHLVLPVLREDTSSFERFLQMYKRVCLQTGENVVLLTVFINIRKAGDEEFAMEDPFKDAKNLIARYKHSYMWAQLPWLQVGVKQASPTLIMDIVSMKLASNALIFIVGLDTDFTINFLNRCRVNAINGVQVFFPIPFMEYDPDIVFKNRQRPTFVDVYRDNGAWDTSTNNLGCFSNRDYKELRMQDEDFLDENQSPHSFVINVFQSSKLSVFRAVDSELRRRYAPTNCTKFVNKNSCYETAAKQKASKSQLAKQYFSNEMHVSL